MGTIFKKWTAAFLALLILIGCSACGVSKGGETQEQGGQNAEEETVMKILTLGNSASVDACHMLNLVAAAEGFEKELVIGTLYYSGCTLPQHVDFGTNEKRVYNFYLSSTATADAPPTIMKSVTMREAVAYDNWDIIFMHAEDYEADEDATFTNGNIQTIQNYVNQHKTNPNAVFGWHGLWVGPADPELVSRYPYSPNVYEVELQRYSNDRLAYYHALTGMIEKYIKTDSSFQYIVPTGTAITNAVTSYLEEKDLHRDYYHASDLGRVIAAYAWYCTLTGVEHLDEIKLDTIPVAFFKSTTGTEDYVLTDLEKAVILESVNNALANPLEITQSQYTEAPAN